MYIPRRTDKFEYAADAIHFVETYQCHTCAFQEPEGPMCSEAALNILLEEPVDFMDEHDGLPICNKYQVVL